MSDKRRIITNTAANGLALVASILSGLIFMPLLVRGFGERDYGLYMLAISVASYASIMDLGVGSAVVKKVAERIGLDDREGIRRLASTALSFYLVVGVIVALVSALVALFAGTVFRVDIEGARLMRNLLYVVAATSLLTWPLSTSQHVLMGFQRYTITSRTSLFVSLGKVLMTLLVISIHQGPLLMLLSQQVVVIAGGIANTVSARHALGVGRGISPLSAESDLLKELFSFSWAVFVIQICVLVLFERTDRLILGMFVGAIAVTYYEAASKFQQLIAGIHSMSSIAVMPTASQLDAEGRPAAIATLFLRGTKYTTALLAPLVVTLMVLARPILTTWLGSRFSDMALVAQILISHQLLTVSTAVGDSMLIGLGKLPKRVPYAVGITVANLVISLVLVQVLPQHLKIMSVVLGTAIPNLLDYPLHARLLFKEIGVPARRFAREVALPVYPLLIIPAGVGLLALLTPLVDSLVGVLLTAAACMGLYWVALGIFGMTEVERAELSQLWATVKQKLKPVT